MRKLSILIAITAGCGLGLDGSQTTCPDSARQRVSDDLAQLRWTERGAGQAPQTVTTDGAWCWFQDERAIFAGDAVVIGSVSRDGDVVVSRLDTAAGGRDEFVLAAEFDRDDHAAPSLIRLADGRIRAFWTKHLDSNRMHSRVTTAGDGTIGGWSEPTHFDGAPDDPVCYSNPLEVDGELALFYRGLSYNPTAAYSRDGGQTFERRSRLLDSWEWNGSSRRNHRPYVKYATGADGAVHVAYTEGHPYECDPGASCPATSIYHAVYRDGKLHRTGGQPIGDGAIAPELGTLIYDGACGAHGEAWIWDLAIDRDGHPVVVYASFPDPDDVFGYHVYHWARWDGARWQTRVLAHAGTGLYEHERYYSGGIALDPDDPFTVYFSSDVNPVNRFAIGTGHYEIYRARATGDDARDWELVAITESSPVDNLRPLVPAQHPYGTAVLWMRGEYRTYTDYQTEIVGLFGEAEAVAR